MAPLVSSDPPSALAIAIAIATVIDGGLAVILSIFYAGGKVLRRRSVRIRLRAELIACIILIGLAAVNIYLAIQQLIVQ